MAIIRARYLDGPSTQLSDSKSVGHIMIHVANLHKRFAHEISVTCPDTGRDLTDPPSQVPPSEVQIAIKPTEEEIADEKLVLDLYLHGQYEDAATCARAYEMLLKRHGEDKVDEVVLGALHRPEYADADIKIQEAIVGALLRADVDLNCFLYNASKSGEESRVRMLLAAGVPVEYIEPEEPYVFDSPLGIAAAYGNAHVVKILLAQKANPNRETVISENDLGTPLAYACRNQHTHVVRELITHKALVNFPNTVGSKIPLREAILSGSAEIVELLLANGADLQPPGGSTSSSFFFLMACKSGSAEILKTLLDHARQFFPKHIGALTKVGELITKAVTKSSPIDLLKILLDVHKSALAGPLLQAVLDGKLDVANLLLDYKADINGKASSQAPLHVASIGGKLDVVGALLSRKANVNQENEDDGKTALAYALDNNRENLVDMLKLHGAILRGNSSNEVFAGKRKRENEDGSASSANKRRKSSGDETSGKKSCLFGSDAVEEKGEPNHSSFTEDKNDREIATTVSGSCVSTRKDREDAE